VFAIQPFRFRAGDVAVTLDWEHSEYEWVEPLEILRRPTVPKLDRAWDAVGAGSAPKS